MGEVLASSGLLGQEQGTFFLDETVKSVYSCSENIESFESFIVTYLGYVVHSSGPS